MLMLLPALIAQADAPATHPERAAVEVPLKAYFRYHQTGDPAGLAEAFHPEALLQWAEKEQRKVLGQAEWQATAAAKRAASAGKPRPEVRCTIVWMEIDGATAVAKVHLDYPTFRFVDYMHLLKLQGGWKIVDKVYARHEGTPRP